MGRHHTGLTDMSDLLEKPAGARGFIHVKDGHLATGDGRRWRIWGQNLTFAAPLCDRELAPAIARRLAKSGLNCIRLHHIDHHWPRGILKRSPYPEKDRVHRSSRAFDAEGMARLDWFIACCIEQGIHINFNLNVSRPFSEADGVSQAEWIGFGKGLTYFDQQLIVLQKEYAAQLLGHVNPYTGNRYAEEPGVALIELVNENSLLESWLRDDLRGEQTEPFLAWGDIPSFYAESLDRRWNAWLLRRYGDREALQDTWQGGLGTSEDPSDSSVRRLRRHEFTEATAMRFRDEATFYAEIERRYFRDMGEYLRGEIGVRQPIIGTRHGPGGLLQLQNTALLDVIDGHCYWQHPRYADANVMRNRWTITNSPMVDQPDHSAVASLSKSKIGGMPYVCTEINEPFPNDYASEFISIMAAYARLQDWDGLFFYSYADKFPEKSGAEVAIGGHFGMSADPVKMAQTALGALVFLRGDVEPAKQVVTRHYPKAWALECMRRRVGDDRHPYSLKDLLGRLSLVHRTEVSDFDAEEVGTDPKCVSLPQGLISSDTGELTWSECEGDGAVLIDTPRHQAVIGRKGGRSTSHMAVDLAVPFSAITLVSCDGQPIAKAKKLLLGTGARVANTGMLWTDESRTSLTEWGEAPTRIEPVTGHLALKNLEDATAVRIQRLDERGQVQGEAREAAREEDTFVFKLREEDASVWHLITIDH